MSEAPKTITLADGDVMTQDENCGFPYYTLDIDGIRFRVEQLSVYGSRWRAGRSVMLSSGGYGIAVDGPREDCIAWVEARLSAMRAALRIGGAK